MKLWSFVYKFYIRLFVYQTLTHTHCHSSFSQHLHFFYFFVFFWRCSFHLSNKAIKCINTAVIELMFVLWQINDVLTKCTKGHLDKITSNNRFIGPNIHSDLFEKEKSVAATIIQCVTINRKYRNLNESQRLNWSTNEQNGITINTNHCTRADPKRINCFKRSLVQFG